MRNKNKKNEESEIRLIESLDEVELTTYDNLIKKEDCIYTLNKDEKTCTLHKILNIHEVLQIPEEIDGHIVTVLENKESESIFENNENIQVKKVILPKTIKIIGKHCFNECRTVETFLLNEGLEKIDVAGFSYCEGITDLILPSTLQIVEDYAFRNCLKLKRLTFLNPNTNISNDLYTITTSKENKDKFLGTLFSKLPSKVQEYAENNNKIFKLLDYVKMDVSYNGIRPTSNDKSFIKKEDIKVLATLSNEVIDEITNYDLKIDVKNDIMTLNISFYKFKDKINLSIKPKKIEKIEVSYHGDKKHKIKNPLNKEDFTVIAYYDNGTNEETTNYIFENEYLQQKGINDVNIIIDNVVGTCQVIGKKWF